MTFIITDAMAEIVSEVTLALDGLEVTTTDQPHDAAAAVMAGGPVVLIMPPDIEWLNYTSATATWTVLLIVGTTDPTEANGTFDALLAALGPQLGLDSATPETYTISDRTFPGYTLTLTTEH
ncbi:MAG: hypothetical protein L0K10_15145 [Brevibacterium aurantiacum]|nr:hypothetical protein [Brevibacterium aurantiacum]